MTLFWTTVSMALLIVALFETGLLEPGIAAGEPTQAEIIITYIIELATIAVIPTALRLFKFKKVEADLQQRHEVALQKWGVLRLSMLEAVLFANLLPYYVFMNTSFGYLAIMTALCLPFVYPSLDKCRYEAFLDEEAGEDGREEGPAQ